MNEKSATRTNLAKWESGTNIEQAKGQAPTVWHGYLYAIEYGNGIKIGSTKNPNSRFKQLRGLCKYSDYALGRFVISPTHTNYCENEKELHNFYSEYRIVGTERFNIALTKFIELLPKLEYRDDSKQSDERAQGLADFMKDILRKI